MLINKIVCFFDCLPKFNFAVPFRCKTMCVCVCVCVKLCEVSYRLENFLSWYDMCLNMCVCVAAKNIRQNKYTRMCVLVLSGGIKHYFFISWIDGLYDSDYHLIEH